MISAFETTGLDAARKPSALTGAKLSQNRLAAGSRALAQPIRETVSFRLTEAQAGKLGLGSRWREAIKRRLERKARIDAAAERLRASVVALKKIAADRKWSQRRLTLETGLSWGGWRRCRDGKANPLTWLPKLQAAMNKLNPS